MRGTQSKDDRLNSHVVLDCFGPFFSQALRVAALSSRTSLEEGTCLIFQVWGEGVGLRSPKEGSEAVGQTFWEV